MDRQYRCSTRIPHEKKSTEKTPCRSPACQVALPPPHSSSTLKTTHSPRAPSLGSSDTVPPPPAARCALRQPTARHPLCHAPEEIGPWPWRPPAGTGAARWTSWRHPPQCSNMRRPASAHREILMTDFATSRPSWNHQPSTFCWPRETRKPVSPANYPWSRQRTPRRGTSTGLEDRCAPRDPKPCPLGRRMRGSAPAPGASPSALPRPTPGLQSFEKYVCIYVCMHDMHVCVCIL